MTARRLMLTLLLTGAGTLLVAAPTLAAGTHGRASADGGDDSDAPPAKEPGVREPGVREPGVREPGVREPSPTRTPAQPQVKVVLPPDKSAAQPKDDVDDDPDLRDDSVYSDDEDPDGDSVTASPEARDDETVDAQDAPDDAGDDEAADDD